MPNVSKSDAAFSRGWRIIEASAPLRWRTLIIRDPVNDAACARICPNVCGGHHVAVTGCRNSRAIDSCPVSRPAHAVNPRINVGVLFRQHASAFLLIEKDHRMRRKPLMSSGLYRSLSVSASCCTRICGLPQFGIRSAVEEHHKSESGFAQDGSFPDPCIVLCTRRHVQPVSGKGEDFPQSR